MAKLFYCKTCGAEYLEPDGQIGISIGMRDIDSGQLLNEVQCLGDLVGCTGNFDEEE